MVASLKLTAKKDWKTRPNLPPKALQPLIFRWFLAVLGFREGRQSISKMFVDCKRVFYRTYHVGTFFQVLWSCGMTWVGWGILKELHLGDAQPFLGFQSQPGWHDMTFQQGCWCPLFGDDLGPVTQVVPAPMQAVNIQYEFQYTLTWSSQAVNTFIIASLSQSFG